HYDEAYASLSALLVARSLNLGPKDIRAGAGGVRIGELYARTDADARMQTAYYKYAGERAPFTEDSFFDVVNGKIAPEKYRDKIVLVGPTAAGVDRKSTRLNSSHVARSYAVFCLTKKT